MAESLLFVLPFIHLLNRWYSHVQDTSMGKMLKEVEVTMKSPFTSMESYLSLPDH